MSPRGCEVPAPRRPPARSLRLLTAASLLSIGCSRSAPERAAAPAFEGAALVEHAAPAGRSAGERSPRSRPRAAAAAPDDPAARALERAQILALRLAGDPSDGRFHAALSLAADPSSDAAAAAIRVHVAPAQLRAPLAYRRPLAFYRLARALGARVVPVAAARRIGIGELAALLEREEPAARDILRSFAVMNDGAVDALVSAPAPGPPGPSWEGPPGRVIRYAEAPELAACARWARSSGPAPGERTSLVRDYVEMLVLDYVAGNALRDHLLIDDAASALVLDDNREAFPLHVKAGELDLLLRRLSATARFPRSLHEALVRFGRGEAIAALSPGGFDEALVPPRALVELDERRAALLTLIEAKIATHGAGATLSL
jgi:hypothetical protein